MVFANNTKDIIKQQIIICMVDALAIGPKSKVLGIDAAEYVKTSTSKQEAKVERLEDKVSFINEKNTALGTFKTHLSNIGTV